MAHDLTIRKSGRAEMAYVGEKPWHGLGQELKRGAPIEEWLAAAGMDWKILRSKVRYVTEPQQGEKFGDLKVWGDYHVLFRSDTHAPLGMVSDGYKVVQPKAVLEFFRDLTASNRLALETAGTLKGGAVYWALAKLAEEAEVGRGDRLRGYVLLSTSANGSRATVAKNTAVRVVCQNTLTMADAQRGAAQVKLTHRSEFDERAVKTDLGLAYAAFDRFLASARALAKRKLTPPEIAKLTVELLAKDAPTLTEKEREAILGSKHALGIAAWYANGSGQDLPGAKGTAWGFVNGVTGYVDHVWPSRNAENRLDHAWFGGGDRLKSDALRLALELA